MIQRPNTMTNSQPMYKAPMYKAIVTVSLISLVAIAAPAAATATHNPAAKQIGFKVIDQPPVVIEGHNNNSSGSSANQAGGYNAQRSNVPQSTRSPIAPSMAMEPTVEGFADKVPLTVAIQQILPQGYGYTLGDGVDAGQLVSWRGGRAWNVVLQEMLAPAALSYSANGRSVAINSVGTAPTIVTGIPSMQAPMQQPVMQQPQAVMMQPQQPIMMDPQAQQQQQIVMQQPQMIMMQPQQQVVMQQPVMMQPVPQQQIMMQPQQQVVMQQPQMVEAPPVQQMMQTASAAPQPLQIENPTLFVSQTWEAKPGQTLRSILQEWCTRVGAELSWTAEFDYPIQASMNMTGTFEEAVRVLLTGFDGAKPTPRGRLHYNPAAGQSILIVEADGNHYGD